MYVTFLVINMNTHYVLITLIKKYEDCNWRPCACVCRCAYVRTYVNNYYTKYGKVMMMIYIRNIEHLTPYFQSTRIFPLGIDNQGSCNIYYAGRYYIKDGPLNLAFSMI